MHIPKTQFSNIPNPQNLTNGNNLVPNDGKPSQKHESGDSNCHSELVLQFRPTNHQDPSDNNSGVNSPPLWKNNNNSPSPPKSPSYPRLSHHNYMGLSPSSRTQAIARGQWELMEMVKNMPESSYELSLKDLVEHHRVLTMDTQAEDRDPNQNLHEKRKKNDENLARRESFEDKGVFLNMVFPWKTKKKKGCGDSGKVSPKPEGVKGEKDWWKKKWSGSSDSDSNGMSNNGGRKRNGCWLCFKSRRSKSIVQEKPKFNLVCTCESNT